MPWYTHGQLIARGLSAHDAGALRWGGLVPVWPKQGVDGVVWAERMCFMPADEAQWSELVRAAHATDCSSARNFGAPGLTTGWGDLPEETLAEARREMGRLFPMRVEAVA